MAAETVGLWTAEERWQILIENVRDYAIFMLTPDGVIVTWGVGGERLFGYKEEEILGHDFGEIFTPQDISKEQPQFELREAKERGRSEDERWHLRKDGTLFWASGVVTPLWDHQGTLRGFAKVVRDITERKRTEERLAEENQRKDEFLAMLSHELRNPLAAIAHAAEVLLGGATDSPTETAGIIRRQVDGLIALINELTDASRISTGKISLQIQRTDLKQVIASALECSQPGIDAKHQTLDVNTPTEPIWVYGDGNRLRQVIANLLDNASKYTEQEGQIWLVIEALGSDAVIRVRDNGLGIASEMQSRIFEMFVQADRSLDRMQGGLGLGLSIAKRLVEMHGGRIGVKSDGVGQGSEFEVRLPIANDAAESVPPKPLSVSERAAGLSLILAEDNRDTSNLLALLLRRDGHSVRVVHDGVAVLQAVAESTPDAVLLDIGLPALNGFDVAERLRQQPELTTLPLIALTGYGNDEDRARSKQAGFNSHFVKPVSIVDLRAALEQIKPTGTRDSKGTPSSLSH